MAIDNVARGLALRTPIKSNLPGGPSSGGIMFEWNGSETLANDKGGNDTVRTTLTRTANNVVQGTNSYYDVMTQLAVNLDAAGNVINQRVGGGRLAIESKYKIGADQPAGTEIHLSGVNATQTESGAAESITTYTETRAFSAFIPHSVSALGVNSAVSFQGSGINFYDGYGAQRITISIPRATSGTAVSGGTMYLNDGLGIAASANNTSVVSQKNAAGNAYKSLFYLNASDCIQHGGSPLALATSLPGNNQFGNRSVIEIQQSGGMTDGGYGIQMAIADTVASLYPQMFVTNSALYPQYYWSSTRAGSQMQHTMIGKDRSLTRYSDGNTKNICAGAYFNGTNKYLISADYDLNTANLLELDVTTTDALFTGAVTSKKALGGIGYATGAGGTVTQATSKSTGVTLNKVCGQITMNAASLAASTSVAFTLTNSTIAATDVVSVTIASGATTLSYITQVEATAAGSCRIVLRNMSAGALAEAVVLNFAVVKAVAA